ncbi:MAG: Rrf2 family transcriptional regulator [Synergistales bacterium]|nr:Rrf2 family transcriptional regulator [Synergistales bacterium]
MKLSTKTRYGLRAMLDLARNESGLPVSLKEIAARQSLSEPYLEKLLSCLRRSDLVETVRGAQGGYRLGREPSAITVAEVVSVLEGAIRFSDCAVGEGCRRKGICPAGGLWTRLQAGIEEVLSTTTLQDLIDDGTRSEGGV